MVSVARFFTVQSAELARMALDSSGIPVFVRSEGLARLISAQVLEGVQIEVPESCVEDARAVLKQLAKDLGGELY
jgi:hypothetical protein